MKVEVVPGGVAANVRNGRFAPGAVLWKEKLSSREQAHLLEEVLACVETAPFYRPTMPKSGQPLSVEMTNFGALGWITDRQGYRYEARHPVTHLPWPAIPERVLALWRELSFYGADPEACLVNRYRGTARMGLHRDADEDAHDAPVLSISLGDSARFCFGGLDRKSPVRSMVLASGDVLVFGGPARFAYHGIARIYPGSSALVPGGGRINLTARRVRVPAGQSADAKKSRNKKGRE